VHADAIEAKKAFGPDARVLSPSRGAGKERKFYFAELPPRLQDILRAQLRHHPEQELQPDAANGAAKEPAEEATFLGFGLLLVAVLGVLGVGAAWLLWLAGGQDRGGAWPREAVVGLVEAVGGKISKVP